MYEYVIDIICPVCKEKVGETEPKAPTFRFSYTEPDPNDEDDPGGGKVWVSLYISDSADHKCQKVDADA